MRRETAPICTGNRRDTQRHGRHGRGTARLTFAELMDDSYSFVNLYTVAYSYVCPGFKIVVGKLSWLTESG